MMNKSKRSSRTMAVAGEQDRQQQQKRRQNDAAPADPSMMDQSERSGVSYTRKSYTTYHRGSSSPDSEASENMLDEEEVFVAEKEAPPPQKRDERKEMEKYAQQETARVCVWKAVVLVIILVTAELVTAGSYRVLKQKEEGDFESSYDRFSNTVQDSIRFRFSNFQTATQSMANSITGAAVAQRAEFPFVTLDDFEVRGQAVRDQTGIETFSFGPYVLPDQVEEYLNYTHKHSDWWIQLSREAVLNSKDNSLKNSNYQEGPIGSCIWWVDERGDTECLLKPIFPLNFYVPVWQHSPPVFDNTVINSEWNAREASLQGTVAVGELRQTVISKVTDVSWSQDKAITKEDHETFHASLMATIKESSSAFEQPHAEVTVPVFSKVNDRSSTLVGQLQATMAWDYYLIGLLPEGVTGITVVLENSCGEVFTYELNGNNAVYRGPVDEHDTAFTNKRRHVRFYAFDDVQKAKSTEGHCLYTFNIYPTKSFEKEYKTNIPLILAIVVGATFFGMIVSFFVYDFFVHTRNAKVIGQAARATGIVSSMFPGQIRDQLLMDRTNDESQQPGADGNQKISSDAAKPFFGHKFDNGDTIADFFPDTTIMFADISGFTAWASSREPAQVFQLLETLYEAFDDLAKQRRVFKVETVGDCYVAAAGLPDTRKDHAIAMARFARDCLERMRSLLPRLELQLGPDTGDLSMRVGLHSGPITAGVLRGERARFQLFGDTMNTASRMESTGKPGMIQVSQDTADLLKAAGKSNWLIPRAEMVEAKGKGKMNTFWLNIAPVRGETAVAVSFGVEPTARKPSVKGEGPPTIIETRHRQADLAKTDRLVEWNVEILLRLIKKIEAHRDALEKLDNDSVTSVTASISSSGNSMTNTQGRSLDEVKEVIRLPHYKELGELRDPDDIKLGEDVVRQLREYIRTVAAMYRDNPFHNFEHASHVAMATLKLLKRVVNPKIEVTETLGQSNLLLDMHDFTYGITSDPLTQFACVFSAVIHDLDHAGVPNSQLVKENPAIAQIYQRSVAEQNSLDLAWKLFMGSEFNSLRHAVCRTDTELKRFRQLVVNLVMATDIMDKDLNGFRNARWEKAFGLNADVEEAEKEKVDRKATIVIEHLIQASDVAHTMQHWHIYRKWNARLFQEMYEAYLSGRAENDPSLKWYEGELGFFDFYIIPLAKKLFECGVFGVTSHEYLDYAQRNRKEWEDRGRAVVAEMLNEAKIAHEERIKLEMMPLTEDNMGDNIKDDITE